MSEFRKRIARVPRYVWWIIGVVAVYSLLGFLLVPWVAERQLKSILEERLALGSQVESISFNPFTMVARIDGVNITNPDDSPLMQLQLLQINFAPTRLALLRLQFSELTVSDLDLYYRRGPDGVDTIARLAQTWTETAPPADEEPEPVTEPEEDSEPVPFLASQINLDGIAVHVVDEVPATPFETTVTLASAEVVDLSTLLGRRGSNSLVVELENAARLTGNGELGLNPMQFNGTVALDNFALGIISRYLQDTLPLAVEDGQLQSSVSYNVDLSGETPVVSLEDLELNVSDLTAIQNGAGSPFFSMASLQADNGSLAIPENRFTLDALILDQLTLAVSREAEQETNLQQLLAGFSQAGADQSVIVQAGSEQASASQADTSQAAVTETAASTTTGAQPDDIENTAADQVQAVVEPAVSAATGEPWDISLQRLALTENRITFTDSQPRIPAALAMNLNLEVTEISNQPQAVFPLTGNITMDSGGELRVEGDVSVIPALDLTSSVTLQSLDLTVLQPYVNEFTLLQLDSALLELQSDVLVNAAEPFAYDGDFHVREVAVSDQAQGENLLALNAFSVDAIDFSLAESTLDISEVLVDSLFTRFIINEDGSTNIGRSIRSVEAAVDDDSASVQTEQDEEAAAASENQSDVADAQSSDEATPAAAPFPFALTIGRIRVADAASDFTDLNLPIPFNANIHDLSGTLEGLSAPTTEPVEFILEGEVDEFGLLQMDSRFDPFNLLAQTRLDLQFSNLQMPPLTPYIIKFAGRRIEDGSMDVELIYNIEGGQLVASNQVVLRNLELGERVEHPDAMDLPLDLATALLKDGNGVIDLEIPVSGDVTDPEFDLGPAVRRAVRNILTSIVSAPFRFLGSLLGGDGVDLDSIRFQPGRSDLAPPERQVLQQLHAALLQRPELVLEVPLLTTEADRRALQTSLVTQRVSDRIDAAPESAGSLTERRLATLEALYTEAGLSPSLEDIQAANTIETEIPNPLTGEPLATQQLDVQAYVADLRSRLVAVEPISDQQLTALAQARIASIRQYLAEQEGELAPSRLEVTEQQSVEPDEDGWLVMEFGLDTGG